GRLYRRASLIIAGIQSLVRSVPSGNCRSTVGAIRRDTASRAADRLPGGSPRQTSLQPPPAAIPRRGSSTHVAFLPIAMLLVLSFFECPQHTRGRQGVDFGPMAGPLNLRVLNLSSELLGGAWRIRTADPLPARQGRAPLWPVQIDRSEIRPSSSACRGC